MHACSIQTSKTCHTYFNLFLHFVFSFNILLYISYYINQIYSAITRGRVFNGELHTSDSQIFFNSTALPDSV